MADLVFPRLVYRGEPDILGLGTRLDPKTDTLIGETDTVEDQSALDAARKAGFRLTRELDDASAKPGKK